MVREGIFENFGCSSYDGTHLKHEWNGLHCILLDVGVRWREETDERLEAILLINGHLAAEVLRKTW